MRVLIADYHQLFLKAIEILLNRENDITVVDTTDDGYECLNLLNKLKPDILIINKQTNSICGYDVINIIKSQRIPVKCIGFVEYNNVKDIMKMYKAGFDGIIPKTCTLEELIKALRYIYNGVNYIENNIVNIINNELCKNDVYRISSLTKRELEILILISSGKYNSEIANNLGITERTVKNHISSIYKKLKVNDRTQAAIYALNNEISNESNNVSRET